MPWAGPGGGGGGGGNGTAIKSFPETSNVSTSVLKREKVLISVGSSHEYERTISHAHSLVYSLRLVRQRSLALGTSLKSYKS